MNRVGWTGAPVPRDLVEIKKQVKAASDILDVISGYLPVTRTGKIHKCICPFHNDTHPSLQIDRQYQNYRCWACGAKGDVFTFVEKLERVSFMEALAILARRAGIALEDAKPQDTHKSRLFDVMKWAQARYQSCLLDDADGSLARQYLGERRLSGTTVREFGLGFAPIEPEWLQKAARKDGVSLDLLVEVGLLGVLDDNRGYWDRFRDRVMFPIRDSQKRTIGFGGRILPNSPLSSRAPKYYNTSETILFKKQEQLYGIDLARHAGSSEGYLAVVEGYVDVMMAHQNGITNVVATMGTALNASHVTQLRRYAPRVVLVFDADAGGQTGVDRALEIFVTHDLELAVASLPEGQDPAELLARPEGLAEFQEILKNASDALEYKLNQLFHSADASAGVEGRRRMLDSVLGVLALAPAIPSQAAQLKRELILTRLSQRLGIDLKLVRSRLQELQANQRTQSQRESNRVQPIAANANRVSAGATSAAKAKPDPSWGLGSQLIQVILAEPELINEAVGKVNPDEIQHTGIRRILSELYGLKASAIRPDLDSLRLRLLDRPDLFDAARTQFEMGNGIAEKAKYLQQIIAGFARLRTESHARLLKERLTTLGHDDSSALEVLRSLQQQGSERSKGG